MLKKKKREENQYQKIKHSFINTMTEEKNYVGANKQNIAEKI